MIGRLHRAQVHPRGGYDALIAQRSGSIAHLLVATWFNAMLIIAVVAVTLEGEVSGGALGGIVAVAMLVSLYIGKTMQPFASLPRRERIIHRLAFTGALFGAWLVIGITAWGWDVPNIVVALLFCAIALRRAGMPPVEQH